MAAKYPQTSRYPNGFANGVEINGMPVNPGFAGKVYWVSATDGSDGNKGTRDRPYATLSKAITSTASGAGDVIVLTPNHKETITDALNLDTTGVSVIGLGNGGQKPTFLFNGGNATDGMDIQVKDVTVDNITMVAGLDGLTAGFDVDATGVTLRNITFKDSATDLHWVNAIQSGSTTDNVCDDLTVENCEYHTATDSNTSFLNVIGDIDRMRVAHNVYTVSAPADASGILINGTAGDDMQAVQVIGNHMVSTVTATDTYVLMGGNDQTDNSGVIADNYIGTQKAATNATNNMIAKGTGWRFFQNYLSNDDTDGSQLHPTAT